MIQKRTKFWEKRFGEHDLQICITNISIYNVSGHINTIDDGNTQICRGGNGIPIQAPRIIKCDIQKSETVEIANITLYLPNRFSKTIEAIKCSKKTVNTTTNHTFWWINKEVINSVTIREPISIEECQKQRYIYDLVFCALT